MAIFQHRSGRTVSLWLRRAAVLAALAAPVVSVAADDKTAHSGSHPEQQLNVAFGHTLVGEFEKADAILNALLAEHPNFKAAHLLQAQLLNARTGIAPAWQNAEPAAAALNDELALRWRHAEKPHDYSGLTPEHLLQTSRRYDRVLLVDSNEHRLYVIDPRPQQLAEAPIVLADYYVTIGKNGTGKERRGDNRTPLGIYTAISAMFDAQLPELYGSGAFPLDYPNSWDRRLKRTGSGIWLHGVPRSTYARAPEASRGCVAMANHDLDELSPHITIGNTQVIIADSVSWLSKSEHQQRRMALLTALEQWRQDWQNGELDAFMRHYAKDFSTAEHPNKASWQQYRASLVDSREKVSVQLSDLSLIAYPGEQDLVEARFQLRYSSATHSAQRRKRQYWRKTNGQWQVVQEEADEGVTGIELAENSHP